ncbi:MAG: hypothetical protein HRT77_15750 [Halioglobus sp.]|nr:hypothetical protein [Halioglobus sp.]
MFGLITACGFHLRGAGGATLPDNWKHLSLSTKNPNGEFARAVVGRFAANGVTWSTPEDANATLVLGPAKFERRNLSLNAEARVSEVELTMRSTFTVNDAVTNAEIMPSTTLAVVKQMESNPRNVVGKEGEERLLREEMRHELADQILRRISFFAAHLQKQNGQARPASP